MSRAMRSSAAAMSSELNSTASISGSTNISGIDSETGFDKNPTPRVSVEYRFDAFEWNVPQITVRSQAFAQFAPGGGALGIGNFVAHDLRAARDRAIELRKFVA